LNSVWSSGLSVRLVVDRREFYFLVNSDQNTKFIKRDEIGQNYKNKNSDIDFGSFRDHHQSKNTKRKLICYSIKTKLVSTNLIIGNFSK